MTKMEPILLQEAPRQPRWNIYLLFILWLTQGVLVIFWELLSLLVVGLADNALQNKFMEGIFLAMTVVNGWLLLAVPYEIYQYRRGRLSSKGYYRNQMAKVIWIIAFDLLVATTSGFYPIFMLCLPWVGSLVYARTVHQEFLRDEKIDATQNTV